MPLRRCILLIVTALIKEGLEANCILLNAEDFYNALNKHVEVLYNIRRGKVLAKTTPAETTLNLPDSLK